jgi:catecholate siderophore receptor
MEITPAPAGMDPVPASMQTDDILFSYKVGVVYKPAENGSVYLSHAISNQPPGGANFALSSAANNVNNPNLDPQKGENLELGTKWDLLEGSLALNAAIYSSSNSNELAVDPVAEALQLLPGVLAEFEVFRLVKRLIGRCIAFP